MATLPQLIEEDVLELNRALHDLLMKTDASAALNARLVLLLANHIGDGGILRQAIASANTVGEQAFSELPAR